MTRKRPAARQLVGAFGGVLLLGAAASLASWTPAASGQAAGGDAGGQALFAGGIPYSPWLVVAAFAVGGFAWSAWGWYRNKNRVEITDPRFKWGRFMKSGLSGIVLGIIVFGLSGAAEQQTVVDALLQGGNGLVGPHEFAVACGLTFVMVGGLQHIWKTFPRSRKGA